MEDSSYAWIFGGLLAVAGVGLMRSLRPGSAPCVSPILPGGRVYLVGDSLAVGMDRYFATMATESGMDYTSTAKISTTVPYWLGQAQSTMANFQPTVVLISLGTNDTASYFFDEDKNRSNIAQLLSIVGQPGVTPVWILPPTLPSNITDRFSQLVRDTGVRVFESTTLDIPRGPDNLHPTASGYAGWAGAVWRDLLCNREAGVGLGSNATPPRARRTPVRLPPGAVLVRRPIIRRVE